MLLKKSNCYYFIVRKDSQNVNVLKFKVINALYILQDQHYTCKSPILQDVTDTRAQVKSKIVGRM